MRKTTLLFFLLLTPLTFLVTQSASASQSNERTLYVMGDSWADFMTNWYGTVEAEVAERGFDNFLAVDSTYAIGGTQVRGWVQDDPCQDIGESCPGLFTEFKQTIANDPNPFPTVFLTLGGNDLLNRYDNGGADDPIFDEIETNSRQFLQELLDVRPDVRIVWGSYDILNFNQSILCQLLALATFGTSAPGPINELFDVGSQRQQLVADEFPRVYFSNVAGTLQGNPGNPDLNSYSPAQFVAFDCIHLTGQGYVLYVDALFSDVLSNNAQLDWEALGCVVPESGPWPDCAKGRQAPPPVESTCIVPESGSWPACATGG